MKGIEGGGLVDANVVLRFLTADHPEMYARARAVMLRAERGEMRFYLSPLTVAEVVWTLDSFYGLPRRSIAARLMQFLCADGIEAEERDILIQALLDYEEKNVDFADAYLARHAERLGPPRVCRFDLKHFQRLGVETLPPVETASPPEGAARPPGGSG